MPRLTADQWAAARVKWEADPTLTFAALAGELGCSHVAVSMRSKKEHWQRCPDLRTLAELAHAESDAREAAKLTPQLSPESAKTRAAAVDLRADVIDRHKADWAEHRQHFGIGDIAADFDTGKSAKISAEMLSIRQKGERAAYGLDEAATTQAPPEPDWTVLIGQKVSVQA